MNENRILLHSLASARIKNANRLNKLKRKFANKAKVGMISNAALLNLYHTELKHGTIKNNPELENLLRKRKIRTLSGVAPVAVLTKPFPCPGRCLFCPTEENMPKSYLSNEPAVMRAISLKFDPFKQVAQRLRALEANGHATDKVELIIMGGTWSCLPVVYQKQFIKRCFDACNQVNSANLAQAQTRNERAKHRIVALTLETRPDYISETEIKRWREYGATKVELGVQIADDAILKFNNRGHGKAEVMRATELLKKAGFKIAYHIMPNLPGATPTKDLREFKKLFSKPEYQPDLLKIYPTVVTKNSKLYHLWKRGDFKPYSDKQLLNLLIKMKLAVPDRVRIIRLIRDIPEQSIVAGNLVSNLRQELKKELERIGKNCHCIRCREARENIIGLSKAKLFVEKYQASGADEYFLQFCSPDLPSPRLRQASKLFAFLRLRLPAKDECNFIPEIQNCAMIREVHTYGRLIPLNKKQTGIQHAGLGTRLTLKAEEIARRAGFKKIAVISGVGVRGYYRKLGYKKEGTYMIKNLG